MKRFNRQILKLFSSEKVKCQADTEINKYTEGTSTPVVLGCIVWSVKFGLECLCSKMFFNNNNTIQLKMQNYNE